MRGTRAAAMSLVGVATLLSPAPTWSQSALPSIQPGDRVQSVDLVGTVTYDSNVAGSTGAYAAGRQITPGDEIFEPSLRFDLARPVGRETVYLQGSAGYDFYVKNSILNRENIDIRPGVLGQLGRCQFTVGGDYSRAQSDLSQLALTPAGPTVVTQQNVVQLEQIAGSGSCGGAIGLAPNASVSQTWSQNSSPVQQFTNANVLSVSAGLGYRRPAFGNVSLFGAYSRTDYPDRSTPIAGLPVPGVTGGYETWSGGVNYTRSVGARLQANASISYTSLTNLALPGGAPPSQPGFSGLTYSASLNYRVTSRWTAIVAASRATVPSIRLNSNYGVDQIYSGELDYIWGPRVTLRGGGSYAHNAYDGLAPAEGGFDLTRESIASEFLGADVRLARRLTMNVNFSHSQRDANLPGLSYPETRASLSLGVHF